MVRSDYPRLHTLMLISYRYQNDVLTVPVGLGDVVAAAENEKLWIESNQSFRMFAIAFQFPSAVMP